MKTIGVLLKAKEKKKLWKSTKTLKHSDLK